MSRLLALLALSASLVMAAAAPAAAAPWFVAGNGNTGYDPADGGPATAALLPRPVAVVPSAGGGFVVGLDDGRVVRVDALGAVSLVAGVDDEDFSTYYDYAGTEDGIPGPARKANFRVAGVAELADGSVLIADGFSSILRVTSDGMIARVAGTHDKGFAGDGGPAAAAQLDDPSAVSVQPDGGYLIADSGNQRIRRVAPDGTITTVAGTGVQGRRAGAPGPRPALKVKLSDPADVAALPDGGYVIADSDDDVVRRVDAAGTSTIIAGNGKRNRDPDDTIPEGASALKTGIDYVFHVAAGPDGSVWFTTVGDIVQIVDGKLHVPDRSAYGDDFAVEPDGGVLTADAHEGRVAWSAPPASKRLAVAIDPATAKVAKRVKLRFTTTAAAAAHIDLTLGSKLVYSTDVEATAGSNTLSLPPALKRGSLYRVNVSLTTPDGRVADDELPLFTSPMLPLAAATQVTQAVAAQRLDPGSNEDGNGSYDEFLGGCERVSATRVDCEVGSHEEDVVDCDHVLELVIGRNGTVVYREYDCPLRRRLRPKGQPDDAPRY